MLSNRTSHEHIFLKNVSVKEVCKFTEDLNSYEDNHGITLQATTLMDQRVNNHIMTKFRIPPRVYHSMCNGDIFDLLQSELRPPNKISFQMTLDANVEFKTRKDFVSTDYNFHEFYESLLDFEVDWLNIYDLLASDNEENVPRCDNESGGLIKSFFSKIPQWYSVKAYPAFKDQHYKHVYTFINLFMDDALKRSQLLKQKVTYQEMSPTSAYLSPCKQTVLEEGSSPLGGSARPTEIPDATIRMSTPSKPLEQNQYHSEIVTTDQAPPQISPDSEPSPLIEISPYSKLQTEIMQNQPIKLEPSTARPPVTLTLLLSLHQASHIADDQLPHDLSNGQYKLREFRPGRD